MRENRVKIHRVKINNLKFVDDVDQFSTVCKKLQGNLDKIAAGEKAGLKINVKKKKPALFGISPSPFNITIKGNVVEAVNNFDNLGSVIISGQQLQHQKTLEKIQCTCWL